MLCLSCGVVKTYCVNAVFVMWRGEDLLCECCVCHVGGEDLLCECCVCHVVW